MSAVLLAVSAVLLAVLAVDCAVFALDIASLAVSCAACAADRAVVALVFAASIPLSTLSGRRDLSSFLVCYFFVVIVLAWEIEMVALA